jgi:hypothetical protein
MVAPAALARCADAAATCGIQKLKEKKRSACGMTASSASLFEANKKGLQTSCLQALMIGAQERTRTSTMLLAST